MTTLTDLRRLPCPGPVMELRKQLDGGATALDLHVADDLARSNVTRFAQSRGTQVTSEPSPEGGFLVRVLVPAGLDARQPGTSGDPEPACELPERPAATGPRVVQISSRFMGQGDDELGALLLRGFVKTLGNVDPKPDIIVCYNGAVVLCCEDAPVLGDLRALEAAGVKILACGTCLNFFDLASRLAVGRVTDMLEIVTTLGSAGQVIRP